MSMATFSSSGTVKGSSFTGVRHDAVEHRKPVAHAAGAARQVHDERPGPHAGQAARERGAGEPREHAPPDGLGDAGRLALEDGAGRLRSHVPRGEPGPAGREDAVIINERLEHP